MAIQIQLRRDTTTNWTNNNPVLANGEIGIDTDQSQFKIGDGATAWNDLFFIEGVDSVNNETGTVILTTGDINEDTDHNYVTDAEKTVIGNTSGTNTGDQSDAEIETAINNQLDGTVVGTSDTQTLTNKTIDAGAY